MTGPHHFRFGIRTATTSLWEWQEIARQAEALGFDTLILQDHLGKQFAPLPALVLAGARTVRLRLGTVVLANDFRHPAMLAKEAATVDVLTSGRLELGLGAGWLVSDYARTGMPFDPPAARVARLAEAVRICKLFFTSADETISFTGKHYRVAHLEASPRPTQKPLPILLAGRQRRMLSLAGREADIVGISLLDRHVPGQPAPPSFAQKVAWVRAAAGARFDDLEIHVNAAHVDATDEPERAIERIAARTGESPAELQASPGTLVGSVECIVEQLHRNRELYALSYYVLHARYMETFLPILARVNGA